jgi:Ca-activated chloride channel homolog
MFLALLVSPLSLLGQVSDCADVSATTCDRAPSCVSNWSFRKDVNEVYSLFTASIHGKLVPDLVSTDITVVDDHKPPEKVLGFYTQRDIPVRLGILVDTSGSVYSQFPQEQAAAGTFLVDVVRPSQDMAFVMGFADIAEVKQDFTNNPGELWRGISTLIDEQHTTALFDAVIEGCTKLTAHRENHFVARALIILSDGEENSSRSTLDDAIRAAQAMDVTVYAIWTHVPGLLSYGGNEELKKLATKSGGRVLSPRSADEFGSALAQIAEELHSRYAIAYRPADFNLDGRYRPVRITAQKRGKKVKIHGRKGYYAGGHPKIVTEPHRFTAMEPYSSLFTKRQRR